MQRHLRHLAVAAVFALALGLLGATTATAAPAPSSDLLLPYFEVQLDGPGLTTLFAVVNSSRDEVPVEIAVHSNWGIELLRLPLVLKPEQVQSVNLRDWLVLGDLPGDGQDLSAEELAHLQAGLCGEASPRDGKYYSSQIVLRRAVGYVTIRSQGSRPDVLFGDYFLVDSPQDFAQGEQLVNIDPVDRCGNGICRRHALRFLEGAAFNAGTELIVWTPRRVQPVAAPLRAEEIPVVLDATAFEEPGVPLGERFQGLLPVQVLRVADLDFGRPFGWLDLTTSDESFIGVRYSADNRYSVALNSVCLPLELPPTPGLRIEKSTNGLDADAAPGPQLAVGTEITWEYLVTNTGDVEITDVEVHDDDPNLTVLCPDDTLAPGESMVCTATGEAGQCGYVNVGSVSGLTPEGARVADTDRSHYFGELAAAIGVELAVNGHDADQGPGPQFGTGDALTFAAVVTNHGAAELSGVEVTDDSGLDFSCPRDTLAPGESMTCTAHGSAEAGSHAVEASARGKDGCDALVADTDPVHYSTGCVEEPPALSIEKATNGHDSDFAPGEEIPAGTPVTWTYVVTNTGASALSDVAVEDDDASLTVLCPEDALAPGESMTCTASGTAGAGPYANVGTASGVSQCGQAVSDSDASHYHGTVDEGDQGCTPGYWKTHTDSWPPTGYSPGQSVQSVFAAAGAYPGLGSASLLQALNFTGGPGLEGAAEILLRAATAALLDAAHPDVDYPRSEASVITDTDAALAGGDRDAMLAQATAFDRDNNLGCPLS